MYKRIVRAISEGRSPILFTCIEGDRLGETALLDGDVVGDYELIPSELASREQLPFKKGGILAERIVTPSQLVLCGGGHVSVAVAKIAKLCGFRITVIDERAEFANEARFPEAQRILCEPFDTALMKISDSNAYYVIVTRGHRDDRACLERILGRPFAYCGMIGSKTKVRLVFDLMNTKGFSNEQLTHVHAPIGLPIGANTPEEIAVSIVGEMIQVKNSGAVGVEWDEALCGAIEKLKPPYAMVTVIGKTGSAPRSVGARMIVEPDGTSHSSVGGGYGEYEAIRHAVNMLQNGTRVAKYTCSMTNADAAKAGMVCGGTIDVLIQIVGE